MKQIVKSEQWCQVFITYAMNSGNTIMQQGWPAIHTVQ